MKNVLLLIFAGIVATTISTHNEWCYPDYPHLNGLLCYKDCQSGYIHGKGGPVCWAACPPNTYDIGALCIKDTYTRGVGAPLHTCTEEAEKNGLLCYPDCKAGFTGVGPVCWKNCDTGYTDDGLLCRRDTHIYGRDVTDCPWHDKCGLCGGEWYNVCGKRRNCGGECKPGYTNDGCTCRRDVHIYGKEAYGRGAGEAMNCGPGEEKDGALCYANCNDGFNGIGPVCWAICNGETTDTGTQCQKKSYGRGVGKVISCLKPPTLNDMTNYSGLVEIFKQVKGFQGLQAIGCSVLYTNVKFWVELIQTFNNCNKPGNWQTVSISYEAGAAVGVEVAGELGIGVDIMSSKGICFVGYCIGVKLDASVGASLNIGYWKSLGSIPGESIAFDLGVDVPGTELGISYSFVVTKDFEYIGNVIALGIGVGLNPFDAGFGNCNTPEQQTIPFTL